MKDFLRGGIEWTHQIVFTLRDDCLGANYSNSQIEIASGIESIKNFESASVADLWIQKRVMRQETQVNLKMPTYSHYGGPDRPYLCNGVIVVEDPIADPSGTNDDEGNYVHVYQSLIAKHGTSTWNTGEFINLVIGMPLYHYMIGEFDLKIKTRVEVPDIAPVKIITLRVMILMCTVDKIEASSTAIFPDFNLGVPS